MLELTEISIRRQSGDAIDWREQPLLINPCYVVSAAPAWSAPYHLYRASAVYRLQLTTRAEYYVVSAMIGDDPEDWRRALTPRNPTN